MPDRIIAENLTSRPGQHREIAISAQTLVDGIMPRSPRRSQSGKKAYSVERACDTTISKADPRRSPVTKANSPLAHIPSLQPITRIVSVDAINLEPRLTLPIFAGWRFRCTMRSMQSLRGPLGDGAY
jgi:hypothetical protein